MSKDTKAGEVFNGFNTHCNKLIKDWKVPGMAIAVVKGDEVIFSGGFGFRDAENKNPVNPDTIFAIGSSSKAFTATAVALLVEQGKLEWDTPVREFMPDFKLHDLFASERMTPRDLLCHRSGLPRHDLLWYSSLLTRRELFEKMRFLEPNRDFRTHFQYQNLMFMTAGYLVEIVSGLSWEDFIRKEIFKPLGMKRSNFSVEDSKKMENASYPYAEEKKRVKQIPFRNIDTIGPAGSINSCVLDMSRWLMLHLNGGEYKGKRILSKANLEQMHTPTMPVPPSFFPTFSGIGELGEVSYGLGWFMQQYRGHKLIHHGGRIDGFSALMSFMPDQNVGVALLTNLNSTDVIFPATFEVYDRVLGLEVVDWNERFLESNKKLREAGEKGKEKSEQKRKKGTHPSHPLADYAGSYIHPGYGSLKVELNDKGLKAFYNQLILNLKHYHYDVFTATPQGMEEAEMKASFFADVQGNIGSISVPFEPNVAEIIFKRAASEEMRSSAFLQQFVGKYQLDKQVVEVVLKGEDTLAALMPGMPELELEPYQGTEFKVKGISIISLEFKKDEENGVTALEVNQGGAVFIAARIS